MTRRFTVIQGGLGKTATAAEPPCGSASRDPSVLTLVRAANANRPAIPARNLVGIRAARS